MMIQANVCAAETLEKKRQPLIYRIHDAPSLAKQEILREFLATLDISLAKGGNLRSNHFNGILAKADGTALRDHGQRDGAALAEPGDLQPREYRPFRPQPDEIRAFHLADPPLCRPDRASRAGRLARASAKAASRPTKKRRSTISPPKSRPSSAGRWRPSARPSTG